MFMVSGALSRQGVIERLTSNLQQLTSLGYRPFLLILLFAVAFLSAFINNTPVVVILLPVAIGLSSTLGGAVFEITNSIILPFDLRGLLYTYWHKHKYFGERFYGEFKSLPDMSPMNMFELSKLGYLLCYLV